MAGAVKILVRRGTESEWKSVNPTLASGEIAADLTNKKFKVGDGSRAWNALDYYYGTLEKTIESVVKVLTGSTGGEIKEPVDSKTDLSSKYPNPSNGDIVFVKGENKLYYYDGTTWKPVGGEAVGLTEAQVKAIVRDMIKTDTTVSTDVKKLVADTYKYGMTWTSELNGYGRPTKITYEDGTVLNMTYNGMNQLTRITTSDGYTITPTYTSEGTVNGRTVVKN